MSTISITALGAVTSVGMDAVSTCASIRAGLSRPASLDGPIMFDLEDYKEVSITGHPVSALARGFSNVGRWLQLVPAAVADLCSSGSLPSPSADVAFWAQTRCVVALPFLDERFLPDPNCTEGMIEGALVAPLSSRVQAFFAPSQTSVHARGRGGVLDCLATARDWIARREAVRVVVITVDSLVDTASLEWLIESNRVKCEMNPIGLAPGEAACAFMLEDSATATRRGGVAIAHLRSVATAPEPKAFLAGESSQGAALAKVIERVLSERGKTVAYTGPIVADLNGEQWRAHEFGCAQVLVDRSLWKQGRLIFPVQSTGDAGTATAGVQIAVACRALTRGYADGDTALVTCSDEQGFVGAAVFSGGQSGS